MEVRKITTKLVGKQELFKTIALGEALKMPVLFVGVPGVAKTQTLLDYGKAMMVKDGADPKDIAKRVFMIELDEGTKSAEVKGRPNMKELLENKTFKMDCPIADAEFVMINEVDKGTSGVRNTLLSVMRERKLFLGGEVRNCKWKVFVGSCNEITKDEDNIPFWDRFIIKSKVDRVDISLIASVWAGKDEVFDINIPSEEDLKNTQVSLGLMSSFIKIIHSSVTDRTIVATLPIVKAIKLIWGLNDKDAIIYACAFICPEQVVTVSKSIEDPLVKEVKGKIMQISKHTDINYVMDCVNELDTAFNAMEKNESYKQDLKEMKKLLQKELNNNKIYLQYKAAQELAAKQSRSNLDQMSNPVVENAKTDEEVFG